MSSLEALDSLREGEGYRTVAIPCVDHGLGLPGDLDIAI